jgi:hypothetical protein
MPDLSTKVVDDVCKMLLVGDSGSGKTGAMASLVDAGYRLFILDFDNGLQSLAGHVQDKTKLKNVFYVSCQDEVKITNGVITAPKGVNAIKTALAALDKWPDEPGGNLYSRTPDDIIVVDSFSFAGKAALRYVQSLRGDINSNPTQPQWGDAMRLLETMLAMLYGDKVRCNVIVHSHVMVLENEETGTILGRYPMALGKKLPPTVPKYFNTMILARTKGAGDSAKRVLCTKSTNMLELKTPVPLPNELPLETGLVTIFKAIRGKAPGENS